VFFQLNKHPDPEQGSDETLTDIAPHTMASSDSRDPSGFLSDAINAPVIVKLNSGIVYKGMRKLGYLEVVDAN
jgi:hypothetical protein